ncbi:MAG: caspase family protein [Puia sp.]|nr:caspase family protein [Puia sp.]
MSKWSLPVGILVLSLAQGAAGKPLPRVDPGTTGSRVSVCRAGAPWSTRPETPSSGTDPRGANAGSVIRRTAGPVAPQQYALLIGINHYAPPPGYTASTNVGRLNFADLSGCLNDVSAIYSLLTGRFDFKTANIDTLLDGSATRERMLAAMNGLLQKCRRGDIAFLFYSGHGSQVKNSLSATKADKLDETLVPADTWKEGVRDIRDKELSKIFNAFLDKGVKLTVIFDCCHSGSISRGPNLLPGKRRFVPAADWDAKDPSTFPAPEDRPGDGFLIFTAAQSDEFAIEQQEPVDDHTYIAHGAFTMALTQALKQESADVSAQALFAAARAVLKNNGASQEPVIGGSAARQAETLFGRTKGTVTDRSVVAVTAVSDDKVILSGGWALGISRGNELAMVREDAQENRTGGQAGGPAGAAVGAAVGGNDTLFKLRIDQVTGIAQSEATVIQGKYADVRPGYLFRVTDWVSPDVPLISFYLPPSGFSNEEIGHIAAVAAELKKSPGIVWLEDLRRGNPYTTVFFDKGRCLVKVDRADPREIKTITAREILAFCKKDSTLYMEIPASRDTLASITAKLVVNHNLRIVDTPAAANYCLFGKLGRHGSPAYGFRKIQVTATDSLGSMPLVTDCFEMPPAKAGLPAKDAQAAKIPSSAKGASPGSSPGNGISAAPLPAPRCIGDSLAEMARKLSKVRAWLNILTTPDAVRGSFPFHLEIVDADRRAPLTGHYKVGDSIGFNIVTDSDFSHYQASVKIKYVYIFALDQSGNMELYFPTATGNDINKFPLYEGERLITEFTTGVRYRVVPPTGTDNFFLLASDVAIGNPGLVFNQQGVNTGVLSRGAQPATEKTQLGRLLLEIGNTGEAHSRGGGNTPQRLPGNWNLKKYSYTCTY